jgi:hypothetical protein
MKQNFSRVERGMGWPAFWKSEGIRNRISLSKEYRLEAPARFIVHAHGTGFVLVNEEKHPLETEITCGPGPVKVTVHVGRLDALPCALVEGDIISSGPGWIADDYAKKKPAGFDPRYRTAAQDPAEWQFDERRYAPVRAESINGGTLYEFETELTAKLEIHAPESRLRDMTVFCGESRAEALAGKDCYLWWRPEIAGTGEDAVGVCPRCAVRYVFIQGGQVSVTAVHQYVDFPQRAAFTCDEPLLNRIWQVAEHTFRLCSGAFFLDGIKRDGWIWSGDAYQSIFINRYLLGDPGVERRTLTALRGNDPMTGHINTIVDYSLLWVMGVKAHVETFKDTDFLTQIFPKVKSLMDFCAKRQDGHGFLTGKDRDWTFIDWAELDKDGPNGAIQMLYYGALNAAAFMAAKTNDSQAFEEYGTKAKTLLSDIQDYYWSEDLGAFVDSFTSGRMHVSRQTNLMAIRCGIADQRQLELITQNVLKNENLPPIKTPYFQFYALDALGGLGELEQVLDQIKAYWGGMLDRGAVTFWEEFDPEVAGNAQFGMYGDPFGKSLCHAWGASPIYLLARYFIGLELCDGGDARFMLSPRLEFFRQLSCTLPIGSSGSVSLDWDGEKLTVRAKGAQGLLRVWDKQVNIVDTVCMSPTSAPHPST